MLNTACTAIRRALIDDYGSKITLHKHLTYGEFLQQASRDDRRYFTFAGVRNPLGVVVLQFHKLRINKNNRFSNPERRSVWSATKEHQRRFQFSNDVEISFQDYFFTFLKSVDNDFYLLRHGELVCIIRFERVQKDFRMVLERIGLEVFPKIPLIFVAEHQVLYEALL